MGVNYHSSWSTATLFKAADMNAPLETLDKAITLTRSAAVHCDGNIGWNGVTGVLSWDAPLRIIAADDGDGKMFTNVVSSGSLTLSTGKIAYVPVSTVDGAGATATSVSFSTASTMLIPSSFVILGVVNSSRLQFYPRNLLPSLTAMVGGETSGSCSAVTTINFDPSPVKFIELTTNSSITIEGGVNGQVYRLRLSQGATGGWAVTWDAGVTIRWAGGSAPTITTAAGYSDWVTLIRSNSTWYGSVSQNYAG